MANWKQIQGRIRRARSSADPEKAVADLFQKTYDGMVAFELAKLHEKNGRTPEAIEWFTKAHERFRRAEWRKKAAEALERLGAPVPVPSEPVFASRAEGEAWQAQQSTPAKSAPATVEAEQIIGGGWDLVAEIPTIPISTEDSPSAIHEAAEIISQPRGTVTQLPDKKKRRRGRRGGRGRKRPEGRSAAPGVAATVRLRGPVRDDSQPVLPGMPQPPRQMPLPHPPPPIALPSESEVAEPLVRSALESGALHVPSRAADPGLASRVAKLEMQLRRLMASPLYKLEVADQAPAGPGMYILLDSDQTTYYYIEPCKTIRAALGAMLRTGRTSAHREHALKSDLAEHLGIPESKVGKYVRENCLVRWLQLDEGAGALAHFAIAVLRPALNE